MKRVSIVVTALIICASGTARADFKYSESSKITGGMLAGMMKLAGAFSKKAREPIVTTHYVKGNYLRSDSGDGNVQIVDLEGRRFINLDLNKKTYSVLTFDEMRVGLEKLQAKAAKDKDAEFTVTPKIEVTPTGNTQVLLGQPTREVKLRVEMQVEAKDPEKQQQAQRMTFTVSSDAWIAAGVSGWKEIQAFHERMAKELNWLPGVALGGDPQMAKGMMELKRNAAALEGLPLLQYASIGMAGVPPEGADAASAESSQPQAPPQETETSEEVSEERPSRPTGAVTKKLGGLFGRFGREKKKQEQPEQQAEETAPPEGPAPAPPPAAGGSGSALLADMTIEVTSYSSESLDAALFEVPAGFREVKEDAEKVLSRGR